MTPKEFIEKHGLTMEVFHAGLDMQTLMDNWKVTLRMGERYYTLDYHTGIGYRKYNDGSLRHYCPAIMDYARQPYKIAGLRHDKDKKDALRLTTPTAPTIEDVILDVSSDIQSVGEYARFEEWAESMGMNPDSRKDEKIFIATLEEEAKMKTLLGRAGFNDLLEIQEE